MKKLAVAGSLTCLVGLIVFAVALSLCGWDFTKISTRPVYEEKQYSIKSENQDIILKDSNVPVFLGVSADDQIHFNYLENKEEFYDFDENNRIIIQKKRNVKWYQYLVNINFQQTKFEILLPKNYDGSIEITTSNAKVAAADVHLKNLKIGTSNNGIYLKNILVAQDVETVSSNGRIEVSGVRVAGEINTKTSNDGIYFNQSDAVDLIANTSNGKIVLKTTKSEKNVTCKTSNNRIVVTDLSAGNSIELQTSNGQIEGSIVGSIGDFTIFSKTSNGKNSLPENSGSGKKNLRVTTSNSNIALRFTD